jgi:hypothetical protein
MRKYDWIPYFVLKNGAERYGTPQVNKTRAWEQIARILYLDKPNWIDSISTYGIERWKHEVSQ